ncbi:MAG: DUF3313 domain-containing protein [Acidobacteria bacterium]|nr:DUF3313 domain-containing protein [Acidobacteriota bacterium]
MTHTKRNSILLGALAIVVTICTSACSKSAEPAKGFTVLKAQSKDQSGFLKNYAALKADQRLEGEVLTYVNTDLTKNLHGYIGVVVDPVQIYVATEADPSTISAPNAERASLYFRSALISAVQDAFPVVEAPGPLVLRLRAAIVGVDAGGDIPAEDGKSPGKAVNISKAIVELELVDSVTGEVIAAALDKEAAGAGEIGVVQLSREERFQLAKVAMDSWAKRVRAFLNAAHELSPEDAAKADEAYKPYGDN